MDSTDIIECSECGQEAPAYDPTVYGKGCAECGELLTPETFSPHSNVCVGCAPMMHGHVPPECDSCRCWVPGDEDIEHE